MKKKKDMKCAIKVDNVSMHFNMATEKVDSLRDYITKMLSNELFYEEFIAVDNVSFEVKQGEVFGIVGTNGSGKSTLLKMIAGVLTPTKGTITTVGKTAPLIELGAGFDGELTGRENIYMNGALLGYTKEFLDEKFKSIVDFAEMWEFLDMPLKNYSSGMTARIAFAIATAVKPDILIADEILAVGDFLFQQKCEQRIKELMEGGTTVLLVSHSIDQIEHLCDRVLWIEKGKQLMLGNTFEVCTEYRNLQNDPSRVIKNYQIVTEEKCSVCGKEVQFRNELGMTYKTESFCSSCGALLRTSDLLQYYLELKHDLKNSCIDDVRDYLDDKEILYCGHNDPLSAYLKQFKGFHSLNKARLHDCIVMLEEEGIPESKKQYDLIIMQRTLAYISDPIEFMQKLRKHLKPGGCILINVPMFEQMKTHMRSENDKKVVLNNNVLCTEWGNDIKEIFEKCGYNVQMKKMKEWYRKKEITNLDETYNQFITTHPYYYFKLNSWAIIAERPIEKE